MRRLYVLAVMEPHLKVKRLEVFCGGDESLLGESMEEDVIWGGMNEK